MAYRTRKDISTHEELLKEIITFKEIFSFIFRSAGNPKIEITAYDPECKKSYLFEISTKYQRVTSDVIRQKYRQLVEETDFLKNFDNIYDVTINAKGTVRGSQAIYCNSDTPWNYQSMMSDKSCYRLL